MNRSQLFVGMAALAVLLCAGAASAQTPANITVVSGNGQLICQSCVDPAKLFFEPMIVRVTDANGQAVTLTPVHWAVTSGAAYGQLLGDTSYTDGNGYASITFLASATGFGTPFQVIQQTTIQATAGTAAPATFTLTQGIQTDKSFTNQITMNPFVFRMLPDSAIITAGGSFTGQVGTTATTPIKVQVVTNQLGTPVPNVVLRIVNLTPNASTMYCAPQAGAGVGAVLTDQNGVATCYPVFGGTPNVNGEAYVSIGGGYFSPDLTAEPTYLVRYPFPGSGNLTVRSTPGGVGALRLISGSGQSQQAGQAASAPLVVQVESASGNPLAGQTVTWTVSPAGAATLGGNSTTTGTNGQATNTVRLSSQASGVVTVTASVQGSTVAPVTFNVTAIPPVTLTGLTVINGNNQSAIVSNSFASPLIVQLNSSAGPAVGVPVTFTISGSGTFSGSTGSSVTVNTGNNGQAQVSVQATSTPGNVTVTASAGSFTQTFSLTVSPAGPTLSASSFVNAADFQVGSLSPCSLATIIAPGLAPGLQGMVTGNLFGPLPYQLANDTVSVNGIPAPLLNVGMNAAGQQQITFQVPCDATPGSSAAVQVNVGAGKGTVNVAIQPASPGIFKYAMTDGVSRPVLVRPDGSFVSLQNPARRGENLVAFVTGLGAPSSPVSTNSVAAPGAVVTAKGTVVVGMAGRGVPLISAQLSDELLGVWMVTFTVPSDISTGNNVVFSVSVIPVGASAPIPSGGASIPVQ